MFVELQQPIPPSILPLATRSPANKPVEFNWPSLGAWSGFGNEEEFPPLTSESPLLATSLLNIVRHLFHDKMFSSDMDSSSPISSEEPYVSTGDYQCPPERFPYVSNQPSSQPLSLPRGY